MSCAQILIVDDEPHNLAALRQTLADEYALVFATTGAGALAAARKHSPALVLLDIQMPGMNGYDVCRAMKNDSALENIPIIFISGMAEVGDEAAGFEVGAVDYIVKPISPPIVRARVRTHLSLVKSSQLEQSYYDAMGMLGVAGHYNDSDTGVHIWRMAAYAAELAAACGWDVEMVKNIRLAAPMHDTGKIGIPDTILRKPAKLNASEWEIMKTHTLVGQEILSRSDARIFRLAAEIALRHHEKWDGSGYPDGLIGGIIPESARIVALADVFDALTTKRPYKDAWPNERAVATLREAAGTHFEPRLVDVFVSILPRIFDIQARWADRDIDLTGVGLTRSLGSR